MTHKPQDTAGEAINTAWRAEQARLKAAQQNANTGLPIEPTGEKAAAIQPTTPPECQGCEVFRECVRIMRMWHNRAARPDLARAWCSNFDKNSVRMCCLSGLRSAEPEYVAVQGFSLRSEK